MQCIISRSISAFSKLQYCNAEMGGTEPSANPDSLLAQDAIPQGQVVVRIQLLSIHRVQIFTRTALNSIMHYENYIPA